MGLVYQLPDQGCPLVVALTGTAGTTFEVLAAAAQLVRATGVMGRVFLEDRTESAFGLPRDTLASLRGPSVEIGSIHMYGED